jgi:hypothetical protein
VQVAQVRLEAGTSGAARRHIDDRHTRVRNTSIHSAFLNTLQTTGDAMKNSLGRSIESKKLPTWLPLLMSPKFPQRQMLRASRLDAEPGNVGSTQYSYCCLSANTHSLISNPPSSAPSWNTRHHPGEHPVTRSASASL